MKKFEGNVRIGANLVILLGIWVETCSVIGAITAVMGDVPPYRVIAGVPARKIRSLTPPDAA